MRVIAGVCKGRHLKPVPGTSTRPTTDKVKEALFNRIGPFFDVGQGLDLYSGSGGLGIEALSRGLDKMIFVDRDPKAVNTTQENVNRCEFSGEADIYRNDARRALKAIDKRKLRFTMIFLDPPYFKQKLDANLHTIDECGLLEPGGIIVVEHHEDVPLAEAYGTLRFESSETYGGKTVVSIFHRDHT